MQEKSVRPPRPAKSRTSTQGVEARLLEIELLHVNLRVALISQVCSQSLANILLCSFAGALIRLGLLILDVRLLSEQVGSVWELAKKAVIPIVGRSMTLKQASSSQQPWFCVCFHHTCCSWNQPGCFSAQ